MPRRFDHDGLVYRMAGQESISLDGLSTHFVSLLGTEFASTAGAYGLQLHWVEGAACQLFHGPERIARIEPGSVVATRRSEDHRLVSTHQKASPWVLSGTWPTSSWMEQMLLDPRQVIQIRLSGTRLPEQLAEMRAHIADTTHGMPLSADILEIRGGAGRLLEMALHEMEQLASDTPLGRLIHHPRFGLWLREALLRQGRLPTIQECADKCHYSRSAFMSKFTEMSGMPATDFLTHWRMNMSLMRFVHTSNSVLDESIRWGYTSDAAFRKTFSKVLGSSPGHARQSDSVDEALDFFHKQRPAPSRIPRAPRRPAPVIETNAPAPTYTVARFNSPPSLEALLSSVIAGL